MKINKLLCSAFCVIIAIALILSISGCAPEPEKVIRAQNLMYNVLRGEPVVKNVDDTFVSAMTDFTFRLFGESVDSESNALISPLSVMLALAMTANGAAGETKSQMERVLGGDLSVTELNEYLYAYTSGLPSTDGAKLRSANSIWFRDDEDRLTVERSFLQTNADYYGAAAYKSPFDKQTLDDINAWVEQNTDGTIDKILDEIDPNAVMYLINALIFDAEWENKYCEGDVTQREFNAVDGSKRNVMMMRSYEEKYIESDDAVGFIKDYKGGEYSFVGLLPNEGVDVFEYASSLSCESFSSMLKGINEKPVLVLLPKYEYDYSAVMNDTLKGLGMPLAFDENEADFSSLGHSARGNVFIGEVLHKTYISVTENGTRAGAVTKVEMLDKSSNVEPSIKEVCFDRPFVYAIIDNVTGIPLFLGTVINVK